MEVADNPHIGTNKTFEPLFIHSNEWTGKCWIGNDYRSILTYVLYRVLRYARYLSLVPIITYVGIVSTVGAHYNKNPRTTPLNFSSTSFIIALYTSYYDFCLWTLLLSVSVMKLTTVAIQVSRREIESMVPSKISAQFSCSSWPR